MKSTILLILIVFVFYSCASIFNSPKEKLTIITKKPAKIVVQNDTSRIYSNRFDFWVNRSKEPLLIKTITSETEKNIFVKPYYSFAFWLNLYPQILWTGFLIDAGKSKSYTYPLKIYIDPTDVQNNYLTYKPLDSIIEKKRNILKLTPLKLFGFVNSGLELSFERKHNNSFTSQFVATYLFPLNLEEMDESFKPHIKGFQIAFEERFYFKKSAPVGPYISIELNYLRNQYNDIARFGIKNIYSDSTYNGTNYPDSFGIKKQNFSTSFKFGYQYNYKRLTVDFYAGLGIRYKDVRHFDRIKPDDEMEMPRHPNIYYITNHEGKYWTICVPLNFRIGWSF